jgi:membrane-associated protease RseP (regulator of RpoE activity)
LHYRLGDSLVTYWLRHWHFHDTPVLLHPLALAGWFGIFVTALNLLPLGQLDGGHVLYALSGRLQLIVSVAVWLSLIPLGHFFWGWWLWAGFILLVSRRGRMVHPPVLDRHRKLPVSRVMLGWATVVLFVLTFTPIPIYLPHI